MSSPPILAVRDLTKEFRIRESGRLLQRTVQLRAVRGVSFSVQAGESLAIVGESGCGKTTTLRMIMRLTPPTSGSVLFWGRDVYALRGASLREYRRNVQVVFQDPQSALSPRMTIREIVEEPMVALTDKSRKERRERVVQLLNDVGIDPDSMGYFPHQFSGGQQQRIAIARALSVGPSLLVLDEPVSALDVSIRAQIMNLLKDLQKQYGLSYILIAHDLSTVRYLSDRIAVMYLGRIVELAETDTLFDSPLHPYARALIAAARLTSIDESDQADVPDTSDIPAGCSFHPRCPYAFQRCAIDMPELLQVLPHQEVACHLYPDALSTASLAEAKAPVPAATADRSLRVAKAALLNSQDARRD